MALSVLRFDMRAPAFSPASRKDLYAAALDMSAWADEQGFDLITLSEHHSTEDGYLPSPVALAGCIVGRTRQVQIRVVALLLPLYDPVKLAEDLTILDIASGGRVGIVAGLGYRPEEYAMFGVDWATRGKRMDACLEALMTCFSGEPFDFEGRRVQLTPRPISDPHPFVSVGGHGRNAARRAARFGLPFQPAVNTPEVLELYRTECERLGVENPVAIPPGPGEMVYVSEDPERSWAEIGKYLLYEAQSYAGWQPPNQRSAVVSDATSVEELRAEKRYLVLTPEECVARAQQGPYASTVLYPLCGGIPPELAWPSLELYESRVLPALRG